MTLSKFYLKLSQEDGRNRWLPRKRQAESETTDGALDDEDDEQFDERMMYRKRTYGQCNLGPVSPPW